MKNLFTIMILLAFSANMLVAQTIVGTDPENKNVVLEEFTGIHCVFCPDGHAIAQGIYDANPDDVVLINIHTGSFSVPSGSQPDFRTPFGAAIAGQSGLLGYPAGTVNRHLFPGQQQGSGTAQGRNTWSSTSNQTLGQPSYLNIELESTIVTSTRQLIVYVEVYYTDDSPEESNLLNIAILQNNISGPQTGGGAGNNYNHMHMLRHMLTGQWGVEISETSQGSLYTGTFAYELPLDYTGVDVVMENLEIVGFVSETHQEVVSGNISGLTFTESNDYDAALYSVDIPQTACSGEFAPVVTLKNYGTQTLTSLEFSYTANGEEPATYSWTGNLAQNEIELVELPALAYYATDNNDYAVSCESPNGESDELPQNDTHTSSSDGSATFPTECFLGIYVKGGDPQDITWSILDEDGMAIAEGGPYPTLGFKLEPIIFTETGCYAFRINDASGQGLSGGTYVIMDQNSNVFFSGNAFEYTASAELAYGMTVDVPEVSQVENLSVYPNPITQTANVEFVLNKNSNVNVAVYDLLGRNVMEIYNGEMNGGNQQLQLNASGLNKGIYFVKLQLNNEVHTQKISVR